MFSVKYILYALGAAALVQASELSNYSDVAKRQNWDGIYLYSYETPSHYLNVCTGINNEGSCILMILLDGQCTTPPPGYNDQVGSVNSMPPDADCVFFADPFCTGTYWPIPPWGEMDVIGNGFFGSNGVTTAKCTTRSGATNGDTNLGHQVYYCMQGGTNVYGTCQFDIALDGACQELPQAYASHLTVFVTAPDAHCWLYSDFFCQGSSQLVGQYGASQDGIIIMSPVVTFQCNTGAYIAYAPS